MLSETAPNYLAAVSVDEDSAGLALQIYPLANSRFASGMVNTQSASFMLKLCA